jgi:hypothetical protein
MSGIRRSVAAKMIVVTVPLVALALAAVAYFAITNATRTPAIPVWTGGR